MRLLVLAALASNVPATRAADAPKFSAADVRFYEAEVKPLLAASCLKCHGADPKKVKGGLDLTSRATTLSGGDTGPAVLLDKKPESLLLKAVHYKNDDTQYNMPPAGKLPDALIAVLTKWVELGLPFDAAADDGGAVGAVEAKPKGADKNYWAYKPVANPPAPAVNQAAWVRNPIDAFIVSKLEAKGLAPNAPAGKLALLRRVTYDLTGLAPTPAEVDAHLADTLPDAYERLVDRLLASPHFGEKWGRQWLDVVRYAESNGYERDGTKPNAWRYRDYVVSSMNADKPYDVFLREQIAGDELPKPTRESVIATGFYRLGTWDDEPADPQQSLYDGYDDIVSVVGQGVLAMTLNCARCHDHKGDFFPTSDYYKLVALVRDVGPYSAERGGAGPHNLADITDEARRREYEPAMRAREAEVAKLVGEMTPVEDAAIKQMPPKDQLAVEDGHRAEVVRKVPDYLKGDELARYRSLRKELVRLQKLPSPDRQFALAVGKPDPKPPETNVLIRGNAGSKGKVVRPGFPEVFGVPDPELKPGDKSSGRRTALAEFLTSKSNPLTARVMMNRLWQGHFGRAIVPTPNDFGKFGEKPTHPELLDYLATEFMRGEWKLKPMHRLMVLSNTYRQSASANEAGLKTDPANVLRWRADMRRLTAEEVRDSILMASGDLQLEVGGPSVFPKIPQEVLDGQSVPGDNWLQSKGGGYDPKRPELGNRRSVYVHVKRSLQVPILATHDQADTDSSCPVRYTTTVPTQALGLLNGEFAQEQAAALARRLERDAPASLEAQVALGLRLTTNRPPTDAEVAKDASFVRLMQSKHKLAPADALARYALLLLNSNEFVYVD